MTRSITVSDPLYSRLHQKALSLGFNSVEQFLESPLLMMLFDHPMFDALAPNALHDLYTHLEETLLQRKEVISRIDAMRQRLYTVYGEMSDSTALIRQDRLR